MSLPIKAELDMQKASATVNGLYGLNAQYCECIRPDDTKLAEYGLKEPAVTVSFKEGTVDLTLFIGNAVKRDDSSEQEKYYCFVKGSSDTECIYAVAKQYLPWVEITAQELISEVMPPNYLVNLRSVEITADGKKTRLFPLVELERLAEMKMYTRKHNYYRISVYDEYNECYWVRAAGLTKKNAEQLLRDYLRQGIMAKMIVCGVENGNKVK
jgi:hypothetical protein